MLVVPTELRQSAIHGIGCFLLAPVRKGAVISRFDPRVDRLYSEDDIAGLPPLAREHVYSYACWNDAKKVWAYIGDNNRFCNHSDTPTVLAPDGVFGDEIAARDLEAGEELTSDYRTLCDYIRKTGNWIPPA